LPAHLAFLKKKPLLGPHSPAPADGGGVAKPSNVAFPPHTYKRSEVKADPQNRGGTLEFQKREEKKKRKGTLTARSWDFSRTKRKHLNEKKLLWSVEEVKPC